MPKKRFIVTAQEARDRLKNIREDIENREENLAFIPNIGMNLVKTTQKAALGQEYFNQLIEDIKTRFFDCYEAEEYNDSLFLIRNATSENIKIAIIFIFNKLTKKFKSIQKKIDHLSQLPAFSILRNKEWLTCELLHLLHPETTHEDDYSNFIYELGQRLRLEFEETNNMQSICPPLSKLGQTVRKLLTPSPPKRTQRKLVNIAKKYRESLWINRGSESSGSEGGKGFDRVIKGYFGDGDRQVHFSQFSDDGIEWLRDMAIVDIGRIY